MNRLTRVILGAGIAVAVSAPLTGTIAGAAPAAEASITVRDGDSLVGIAHRTGVRLSALLRANDLRVTSVIHPGDTLVIPEGATAPASPTVTTRSTPTAQTAVSGTAETTYTVVAGDALAGIAWRHGVKLGALVKANGLTVSSLILPGRQLRLPPATMPIPAPRTTPSTSTTASGTSSVASTGGSRETLLSYVRAQVGVPYRFFSAGPDAFDCSGLVVAGFRQIGVSLPHQSRALARTGTAVDWRTETVQPGDLVFTSAVNDPELITHVGIALDSRRMIHAVGVGRTVSITSIPSADKVMAVRRITLP